MICYSFTDRTWVFELHRLKNKYGYINAGFVADHILCMIL